MNFARNEYYVQIWNFPASLMEVLGSYGAWEGKGQFAIVSNLLDQFIRECICWLEVRLFDELISFTILIL